MAEKKKTPKTATAKQGSLSRASRSNDLIYCADCNHLIKAFTDVKGFKQAFYRCGHPNATVPADTWLKKDTIEIHPEIRNKNNDCKDFQQK